MRLPILRATIARRILANWRADPAVVARLLPRPFRPHTVDGHAIVGVCLIRLASVRPAGLPAAVGLASENAAHRFAVEWDDPATGAVRTGVYVPRRDTGSRLNALLGGRLVPGRQHHAHFDVTDSADRVSVRVASDDGRVRVDVAGTVSGDLPAGSAFGTLAAASDFFRGGAVGYSATADGARHDGLELRCREWIVRPLAVDRAASSFVDDPARFPPGSAAFDCALLMRDVDHEWHSLPDLCA